MGEQDEQHGVPLDEKTSYVKDSCWLNLSANYAIDNNKRQEICKKIV